MIAAFIDDQRAAGHAVESICRVPDEQGCQVAARTYRSWKQPGRVVAARTITDAQVGLQGVRRSKKVRTMIPDAGGRRALDLLNRNFHAVAPNQVWGTDFTYVRSWAGFVYVAFIVDVFA